MPSVESHQDILFDINSFGGFLNLLIYYINVSYSMVREGTLC